MYHEHGQQNSTQGTVYANTHKEVINTAEDAYLYITPVKNLMIDISAVSFVHVAPQTRQ